MMMMMIPSDDDRAAPVLSARGRRPGRAELGRRRDDARGRRRRTQPRAARERGRRRGKTPGGCAGRQRADEPAAVARRADGRDEVPLPLQRRAQAHLELAQQLVRLERDLDLASRDRDAAREHLRRRVIRNKSRARVVRRRGVGRRDDAAVDDQRLAPAHRHLRLGRLGAAARRRLVGAPRVAALGRVVVSVCAVRDSRNEQPRRIVLLDGAPR
mmetsp:Transcript_24879/g.98807  ORF Transcript_24879/g.98807 Transcript_24879/m.98807 type:complete len:214 (-) Transcript_24879:110-751(-)